MSEPNTLFTMTAPGLLAFPVVTEEQLQRTLKFREDQAKRGNRQMRDAGYEVSLLLDEDHPDLPGIKAAIVAAATGKAEIGAKYQQPIKRGSVMADKNATKRKALTPPKAPSQEYLRDKIVLVARSKFPVALGIFQKGGIVNLDTDALKALHSKKFFAGAEALIQVRFAWYDPSPLVPAGGVNAFLQTALATGRGKPFPGTGERSVAEAFKGYAGHLSNEDPLAGTDPEDNFEF